MTEAEIPSSRGGTYTIEAQHAALIHIEVSLDAFGLIVHVLLEALAYTSQSHRCEIQGPKHPGKTKMQKGQLSD